MLTSPPPSSHTVIAPSSPQRAVRWAAAAAIGSLALFAAVSVGQVAPMSLAAFNPSRLGQEDTLANAEAQRRTAAANEAEATQTARNARDAQEMADAVQAEAEAEAERLTKYAAQKRKDFELAKADTADDGMEATSGIQLLEDEAMQDDADLTLKTTAYDATRAKYANSTASIETLTGELKTQTEAAAAQKAVHEKDVATATTAKTTADTLSKEANALNAKTQSDPATGEVTAAEAKSKADAVAKAAAKAKAAEIVAARAEKKAADSSDALSHEELVVKTATEAVDAEKARNKRLAVASTQAEQDMIQQSHITSLARVAATDAKSTAEGGFYNSSSVQSELGDAADKAEEDAKIASDVAATRAAEAKKAALVAQAAEDSAAVSKSQLALAESEVKVEQAKIAAAKNIIADAKPGSYIAANVEAGH